MNQIKNIAVLGSGIVGQTMAKGLQECGYTVAIGSRNGKKLENWTGATGTFAQLSKEADLIVLAVKGDVAEEVLVTVKPHCDNKIIIDTTNPIDHTKQPVHGVLGFFTTLDQSLAEKLQNLAPNTHIVKAFNSVGANHMFKPQFKEIPSMFICGNDDNAKEVVKDIVKKFGWDVEDMGAIEAARAIEPLCILWCIPGFAKNDWSHAFKMIR